MESPDRDYALTKEDRAVEVSEDGIYSHLGDQLVRYRESLKVLETRLAVVLSPEYAETDLAEAKISLPRSPLRAAVEDLSILNSDLETITRRIEL